MAETSLDAAGILPGEFRRALRHFASGVTVITLREETGAIYGMTATAFTSLSLDPPLVLVAVSRESRCHGLLAASRRFGVSILHEDQIDVSRHFGGAGAPSSPPSFAMIEDTPVIEQAMVGLSCQVRTAVEGGDHTIFIGLVTAAVTKPGDPLIHYDGRYRRMAREN